MKKFIIILGVLSVSLSAIFVRFSTAPSLVLVLYRVALASLFLTPPILLRHRDELRLLSMRQVSLCLLSGLCLGLHFTTYFESLRYTSIASAVVLVNTEVFFVAFAMIPLFHQKISRNGWIGIACTFAGSLMIAASDAGGGANVIMGDAIALAGAFFMAGYTIIGTVCRRNMSTTVYTFLVYLSSALTVLVILLVNRTPVFGYDKINWLTALGMAVFCTLLGHSVFSWGLKYVPASYVSTVKLLEPVFSVVWGILLFTEIPGMLVAAGGLVVIVGVFLYSRVPDNQKNNEPALAELRPDEPDLID